jgi:hypothetical protein
MAMARAGRSARDRLRGHKLVERLLDAGLRVPRGPAREGRPASPKVIKAILDDGSFCDDELTASYFGGVLASSKTEVGCDDRGATSLR